MLAWRLGVLASATAVLALPAFSDIKAYNAAVIKGDFAAATLEAEQIWPTYDKTRADTTTVAREFAWTALRARQHEKAKLFAKWLVEEGPRHATPDADPLLAKVLWLWAELEETPREEDRLALSNAIRAWDASGSSTRVRIPAVAASVLYATDWSQGEWSDAQRDALLAAGLAAQLGQEGAVLEESARVAAVVAEFLDSKEPEAYFKLADVHDALMMRMGPPKEGERVEDLEAIDWRADAWLESIATYFRAGQNTISKSASDKRDARSIEERRRTLKSRCGDLPCIKPTPAGATPQCRAAWVQQPPIIYPQLAAFSGMIGTTILELTTDASGAVTDTKILAAVPSDTFPERTIKAASKWMLKKDKNALEPCTLAGARQLKVIFQFP